MPVEFFHEGVLFSYSGSRCFQRDARPVLEIKSTYQYEIKHETAHACRWGDASLLGAVTFFVRRVTALQAARFHRGKSGASREPFALPIGTRHGVDCDGARCPACKYPAMYQTFSFDLDTGTGSGGTRNISLDAGPDMQLSVHLPNLKAAVEAKGQMDLDIAKNMLPSGGLSPPLKPSSMILVRHKSH